MTVQTVLSNYNMSSPCLIIRKLLSVSTCPSPTPYLGINTNSNT